MVSKGDSRRSLFAWSFDMRGQRLIEMLYHHHEQHIVVSGIPAHHRRPPPSTGPGLSATYLYLTSRTQACIHATGNGAIFREALIALQH